ncbi:MAG: hypothetical protein KKF12_06600 [Proteobacteria bacterium]|nr:hypothetical protein [Pseudomonadota bacterium]
MEKNFRPFIVDVEASGFGSASYPIEIDLTRHRASADAFIQETYMQTRAKTR